MSDSEMIAAAEARGLALVVEVCQGEMSWAWVVPSDNGDHARWATRDDALSYMRSVLTPETT